MAWLKNCTSFKKICFEHLMHIRRNVGMQVYPSRNIHSLMVDAKQFNYCKTLSDFTLIQSRNNKHGNGWSKIVLLDPSLIQCQVYQCRFYAKKMKKAKGSKSKTVHVSDEDAESVIDIHKMRTQMEGVVEELKEQFIRNLSLRTSLASFENLTIKIEDGKKFPLNQLAQITQKTPQLLIINMAPSPQYLVPVKDALLNTGMNINPQVEATTIVVPIPKVTKEHRENLAKSSKTLCDKAKVKLRDIHSKFSKQVNSQKSSYSEDLIKNIHDTILQDMRGFSDELDNLRKQKVQELTG